MSMGMEENLKQLNWIKGRGPHYALNQDVKYLVEPTNDTFAAYRGRVHIGDAPSLDEAFDLAEKDFAAEETEAGN